MAIMREVIDGLTVLAKHVDADKAYVSAEHDELWAQGPAPDRLPREDAARLEGLRWRWDEAYERWHKFT